LNTIRHPDTATLLPNGKVLVTGSAGTGDGVCIAEIYDPASGTWTQTSPMTGGFTPTSAPLLFNGQVLLFGGFPHDNPHNADIYNPTDGTWSAITNAMRLFPTEGHTITLLSNGKVLFLAKPQPAYSVFTAAGIQHKDFSGVHLYDLAAGTVADGAPLAEPRSGHTATLLLDGQVLVVGGASPGLGQNGAWSSGELYNPISGRWTQVANHLAAGRTFHSATLLPNGKVLIAGGMPGLSSTELYDPGETAPLR
jgi:N-acetylneuraminic acid mutarotase